MENMFGYKLGMERLTQPGEVWGLVRKQRGPTEFVYGGKPRELGTS